MYLFLISFLVLYGGMHAYAFFRMRAILPPGFLPKGLLAAWMFVMTLAPLMVRLFERAGMDRIALSIAWPGYLWMGFVFLLASTLLLMDVLLAITWLAGRGFSFAGRTWLTPATRARAALLVAGIASVYAVFEAGRIQNDHVTIRSAKLPAGTSKIRIVQISDVHIGLLLRERRLEQISKVIRQARPDILVSTGDLVDGRLSQEDVLSHQSGLAAMLKSLPTPLGKFAVTGNHEAYAGLQQALDFTAAAGFTILRGQSALLPGGMAIIGVDDQAASGTSAGVPADEKTLLDSVPVDTFRLLLKHRPLIAPGSDGRFDLQLSGHVHNGQIFPFNLLVKMKFPIPCGTSLTGAGSQIHVSRGTGTWGPPMRLFAKPEVTVIDILPGSIFSHQP